MSFPITSDVVQSIDEKTMLHVTSHLTKHGLQDIIVNGQQVQTHGLLGEGGTKRVYDVEIGKKRYALALPGIGHNISQMVEKWEKVLYEPKDATVLRELGFYVNNTCLLVSANIGGENFPAMIMTRYEDHPFSIHDVKSKKRKNTHRLINIEQEVDDNTIVNIFSTICSEIRKLVNERISLGRDSVNLCTHDGTAHMYFNDLGNLERHSIARYNRLRHTSFYVDAAVGALIETTESRAYTASTYLRKISAERETLNQKLIGQIIE